MQPRTISVSYCKCYLISGKEGYVLVDTGNDSKAWRIFNYLSNEKIAPQKIKFIIITHSHFDHTLGLSALKRATGAKIIVHRNGADNLRTGLNTVPGGTMFLSRLISRFGSRFYPGVMKFPPAEPDIIVDEALDMNELGFDLQIIHTPGHSDDCLTVVRNGHFAIVGDAVFGSILRRLWPPFANDEATLYKTWSRLLALGVPFFYPGHGRRLRAGEMKRHLTARRALGLDRPPVS
jgi:hydroxyacylglutathione hydrolase